MGDGREVVKTALEKATRESADGAAVLSARLMFPDAGVVYETDDETCDENATR